MDFTIVSNGGTAFLAIVFGVDGDTGAASLLSGGSNDFVWVKFASSGRLVSGSDVAAAFVLITADGAAAVVVTIGSDVGSVTTSPVA